MVISRDTARATTPSATPNGASVSSSPCATAASTGAGTRCRRHDVGRAAPAAPDVGVRPRPAQPVVVGQIGGGQRVQPGHRLQRRPLPHPDQRGGATLERLGHPQRTRQHRVGLARRRGSSATRRRAPTTRAPPAPPPRPPSPASHAGWPGADAPGRAPRGPRRTLGDPGQPASGASGSVTAAHASRPLGSASARRSSRGPAARRHAVSRQRPCNVGDYAHIHVRDAYRSPVGLPAAGRVRRAGERDRRAVRRGRAGPVGVLGRAGRPAALGRHRSPRCSTGPRRRSRSGSSAASSTSPTTASTATSRRATATGSRSTGRASRSATPAPSPTPSCKDEVCKAANALTDLGLVAGDRVAIYMPMVPEAIVAMLACARLGVMHSVVFAGFSATALQARIEDAEAKLVITTDGQYRRGKAASLKEAVDEAVEGQPVGRARAGGAPHRDRRRRGPRAATCGGTTTVDGASTEHTPEAFDSEHPLFLLYTSGTTGKPKGIVHTTGGYLTQSQLHPLQRLRRQARDRRVLVHRRHRLGHRAHLHRLRAAVQRRHPGGLRGHARLARPSTATSRSSKSTASQSITPRRR